MGKPFPVRIPNFSPWQVGVLQEGRITISGKDGSDAKTYLEKKVIEAIEQIQRRQNNE